MSAAAGRMRTLGFAALAASFSCLALLSAERAAGAGCTITWDRGASTNSWHDAANWTGDTLPGAVDVVCIPAGFSVTHTQAVTTAVAGLELRSPLTVSGGGTLRLGAQGSLFAASLTASGATIENQGGAAVVAGSLIIGGTGVFDNQGTLDFQSDSDVVSGGGSPVLRNPGTLRKSAGTADTVIFTLLDNDGTVQADAATLRLSGTPAGNDSAGAFKVASGAILEFAGNHTLAASSQVTGIGTALARLVFGTTVVNGTWNIARTALTGATVTLAGSSDTGELTISSGTLNANDAISPSAVTQSGGVLQGSAAVETPSFSWSGGSQGGGGVTRVSGALAVSGGASKVLGRRLELPAGSGATLAGTGGLFVSGVLDNQGSFDVQSDADIFFNGGAGELRNGGTLKKSGGSGETSITAFLDNDGTLRAETGSIRMTGGTPSGQESAGSFIGLAGTVLDFGGGTFRLTAASSVSGPVLRVSGATLSSGGEWTGPRTVVSGGAPTLSGPTDIDELTLSGGTLTLNEAISPSSITQTSGALQGSAVVDAGSYTWTGGSQGGTGTTRANALALSGTNSKLLGRTAEIPEGATATLTGTGGFYLSGVLDNRGSFEVQSDTDIFWNGGSPEVENRGTFVKSGGGGETLINTPFDNAGTVRAAAGTLNLSGTFRNYSTSTRTLTGGRFEVLSTLKWTGADLVTNAAELVLDGPGSQVVDQSGQSGLRSFATNAAAGTLRLQGGKALDFTRRLRNNGAVELADSSVLGVRDYVQGSGATAVEAEASRLVATGGPVALNGGRLVGNGTVQATVLNRAGEVRPGASQGTLSVLGDYTQDPDARLVIDIDDGAHDRLAVSGSATLAGVLELATAQGFSPAEGSRFEFLSHASASGRFGSIAGRALGGGLYYNTDYGTAATAVTVGPLAPVELSISDVAVDEGDNGTVDATFTVTTSEEREDVSADFATADASASAPGDYEAAGGTLTFAAGELEKTITVRVVGDRTAEPTETFTVVLSNPNAAVFADGSGTGTIHDSDPAPLAAIDDVTVDEGDADTAPATFTISLTEASGGPVAIAYATGAGSATSGDDYTPTAGTAEFAPGETSKTVTVPVRADRVDEPDEEFFLHLRGAAGAKLPDGEGKATIVDDDDQCESLIESKLGTDAVCGLLR